MSLKNYYAVLGVPQAAGLEEIRSAFRKLAKKYHPDKAPDNPFAAAHFKEIQEAYEVLSHAGRRAAYDEERWLRGLSGRTHAAIRITPQWVLGEAGRLRRHMATVDTFRMDHTALRDYIEALLSPEHLSVLRDAPELHGTILEELLLSTKGMHYRYTAAVASLLRPLAFQDQELQKRIDLWEKERLQEARWVQYRPLIVMVFTLLLCALIWWIR